MEEIKKAIREIANEEYERANKKFPLFNSDHEGVAVIEEELIEAAAEMETMRFEFHDLKHDVFNDNDIDQILDAESMKEAAINACAECIQVIAMCDKFIESKAKREAVE